MQGFDFTPHPSPLTPHKTMSRRILIALLCLFFTLYLACGIFLVYYGRYTGDEGWYAYVSAIVWQGRRPYRDFLYSQTPVLPYFYGAFFSLFGHNLYTGRWISLGCAAVALALIVATAIRRGSLFSGLLALILLGTNLSFIFDTTSIKTQALTGLWLALTLYFAALAEPDNWRGALANIFAALALLTRLSMLPLVILLWIYLWRMYRPAYGRLCLCIAPGMAVLAGVISHFWSDNLWFGTVGMHRIMGRHKSWGTVKLFLRGFLSNQLIICLLLVGLLLFFTFNLLKYSGRFSMIKFDFEAFTLASYICISTMHLAAPTMYPIYQTSIIFLAALWVSLKLGRIAQQRLSGRQLKYLVLTLLLACMLNIKLQEHGIAFYPGRNLSGIDHIARIVSGLPANPGKLISFDPGIAFQSGVPLLPGYEEGDFSFFPYLGDKDASDFRVTNFNAFRQQIATGQAGILALRYRDIAILKPQDIQDIIQLIKQGYKPVKTIKGYGQFGDSMNIFVKKG